MLTSPRAFRKLRIVAAVTATAVSAWLIASIVVMAGMRGAFGSHPMGEQLRFWQYVNCGIVVLLQGVATFLIAGLFEVDYSNAVHGNLFSSIGCSTTWQRYAVPMLISIGMTVLLVLAFAALKT